MAKTNTPPYSSITVNAFIESMKAKNWLVSTCDITGIWIPEGYREGVFDTPEGATLTAIFSRCPKTGEADISIWVNLEADKGYWISGCPDDEVLHCLQRFGSRKIWEWVETQIDLYRGDVLRLNTEACPEGYYIDYRVDQSSRRWLYYKKCGPETRVKSCPYQYWLLKNRRDFIGLVLLSSEGEIMQASPAEIKQAAKLPPLVNFPGEGFIEMTANEYKRVSVDYKGTCTAQATAEHGAYRYRGTLSIRGIVQVYITDLKRLDPPKV